MNVHSESRAKSAPYARGAVALLLALAIAMLAQSRGMGSAAGGDESQPAGKMGKKQSPAKKPKPAKRPAKSNDADDAADNDDGPPEPPPKVEYETVTLADGTTLQIEKWGETFKGYNARPPLDLDDRRIQEVVNYQKLKRGNTVGAARLQIDAEGGKMYWCDAYQGRAIGRVTRATLDGAQVTDIATGLRTPHALAIDTERKRIYWRDGEDPPDFAVKSMDSSGKNPKTLISRLKNAGGLALDVGRGELYYWEADHIVRVKTDGTGESVFIDGHQNIGTSVTMMAYEPIEEKLYWGAGGGWIRRANRDATQIEDAVNLGNFGEIAGFDLDAKRGKIYWVNRSYGQLARANLDGPQAEMLVMAPGQKDKDWPPKSISGVALDLVHNKLYWTGSFYAGVMDGYATISRVNLPPVLKPTERPSPPVITSVAPLSATAGNEITITGKHLGKASAVRFIDDSTRKHVVAKFRIVDDNSVVVFVPKLGERCENPVILVQTPDGVTVTLSKHLKAVKPRETWKHDRFRAGTFPQLCLMPESQAGALEQALVCVDRGALFSADGRGEMTVFAKSGARLGLASLADSIIYHEPFVIMTKIGNAEPTMKLIPTPAIRLSFLDQPLTYAKR